MLLESLVVLGFVHVLPGLCLVELLDLGRSREERFVLAAVLGGPFSALAYLACLVTGSSLVYWIPAVLVALLGLVLSFRSKLVWSWPRRSVLFLVLVLVTVAVPYGATTGSLYRVDDSGTLLLDQALQRDALFHLGIVRSLETSYPPRLLSVAGAPVGYHAGYHLQLALWSRFFGIAPMDGLVRLGALWSIALYVFGGYLLARRFTDSEWARLASVLLLFGSGLGFVFYSRPSVDWWSLAFMDWGLVSILLLNPLLPALSLFFVGASLLHDYAGTSSWRALAGSVFALGFLFSVKMFLGAQVLGALALAALLRPRANKAWVALGALTLASAPFLIQTLVAASSSNTRVGLRPLEIVRYSMEKLDWSEAVSALEAVGRLESISLVAVGATALWFVGFLGLRAVGLGAALTSLRSESLLLRTMAAFVAIGFPLTLLLRIAPGEAEGLSRLEALNDAGWFATESGVALWFFVASTLSRWRPLPAAAAVVVLALPSAVQHFVYAASLEPDRVAASRVEGAARAAALSSFEDVWIEPPDRVRPSLLAYLSGRSVVYDSYVGYDYMFVGRDEIDYRRHAVAQFWSSEDPGYLGWFLDRFEVDFVWREGRELPLALRPFVELEFANEDVELFRVGKDAVRDSLFVPIASVGEIPSGGRGLAYFGAGFERRAYRSLLPGPARLYVPFERGFPIVVILQIVPEEDGEIRIEGVPFAVDAETESIAAFLPPREARGLAAIDLYWTGAEELPVLSVTVSSQAP